MVGMTYVYDAISIEPPIAEGEIVSDAYNKVTWDDPRMGDGYFLRVASHSIIGIGFIPTETADGTISDLGVVIQVDPLSDFHHDDSLEEDIRQIVNDFGIAPSGVKRLFDGALYIEKDDIEEKIVVLDGSPVRVTVR
jgi:hypothetical protein